MTDQIDEAGAEKPEVLPRQPYERPELTCHGLANELVEYVGIVNTDGPVGSSGAP